MKMTTGNYKKIFFIFSLFLLFFMRPSLSYSQTTTAAERQGTATVNYPIRVDYNGESVLMERIEAKDSSGNVIPNKFYYKPITAADRLKGESVETQLKYKDLQFQVDNNSTYTSFGATIAGYKVISSTNNSLNNLFGSEKISEADARKIKTAGGSGGDKGNYTTLGELTKVPGTNDQYMSSNPQYAGYKFTIEQDSAKTGLQVTRVVDANGVEKLKVLSDEEFAAKQKAIEAEIAAANESQIKCNVLSGYFFECSLAKITYVTVFGISKTALKLTGTFFDWTIDYTIVKLKSNLGNESVITVGWRIFRDIANILFIFFMIYIAITTIISGTGKTAEGIKNIIVVAVLINFSLFFTKVIIDVSNTASVSFYNSIVDKIIVDNPLKEQGVNGLIFGDQKTVAEAFISRAGLVTFFNVKEGHLNYLMITKQLLLTSLVYLVVAVVLFMASLLLVTRYIILIVVMLLSSLAFGAYILPSFKKQISEKWWGALIGQSFVAPVFLLMLYISLTILSIIPQTTTTNIGFGDLDNVGHENVLQLIMVIGLLIFSIRMAKSMSDKAGGMAGTITKMLGTGALGLAAWTGRNTVGRGAAALARNLDAQGAVSGFVKRRFEGAANSSFDIRSSRIGGAVIKQSGVDMGKAPKDASFTTDSAKRAANAKKRAESISNEVDPNDAQGRTHREIYQQSRIRTLTGGGAYRAQAIDKAKYEKELAEQQAEHKKIEVKQRIYRNSQGYQQHSDDVEKAKMDLSALQGQLNAAIGAGNSSLASNIRTQIRTTQQRLTASEKAMTDIDDANPIKNEIKASNQKMANTQARIANIGKPKEISQADILKQLQKLEEAQKSK